MALAPRGTRSQPSSRARSRTRWGRSTGRPIRCSRRRRARPTTTRRTSPCGSPSGTARNPRELADGDRRAARGTGRVEPAEVAGPGLHQPAADRRTRSARAATAALADDRGSASRRPTAAEDGRDRLLGARTSPSRCTSATCAARSSATRSRACSSSSATRVIRQNHLGDWGTQFGMLTAAPRSTRGDRHRAPDFDELGELYHEAQAAASTTTRTFADAGAPARRRAPGRRRGDARAVAASSSTTRSTQIHAALRPARRHAHATSDVAARASTTPLLAGRSPRCSSAGARASRARAPSSSLRRSPATRHPAADRPQVRRRLRLRHHRPRGDPLPRRRRSAPTALIYVVDARQAQHFAMVFDAAGAPAGSTHVARRARRRSARCSARTASRSRRATGGTVTLVDCSTRRSSAPARSSTKKPRSSPEDERERDRPGRRHRRGQVRRPVARAASATTSSRFDRMLALNGNTGAVPAVRARARDASIAAQRPARPRAAVTIVAEPRGARAGAAAARVRRRGRGRGGDRSSRTGSCTYLYELAGRLSTFYESCPVLKAERTTLRTSRLALCELTSRTLRTGLALLGIAVPGKM